MGEKARNNLGKEVESMLLCGNETGKRERLEGEGESEIA